MNIGILTELFPPSIGGQEQRFAALADLLAERGHQVTVMCLGFPTNAPAEQVLPNGVVVLRRPRAPHYYKPLRGLLPRSPVDMVRYALAARRLTKARQFDALFLNQWPLCHILALPQRDRARAVVDWCEIRSGKLFGLLQRVLPTLTAGNTAVSTHVAERIRAESGAPVVVLPSGIDLAKYRTEPLQKRTGILCLGRIAAHKNLDLTISAFEELCSRGFDETLTIAGDGPHHAAVCRRVEASPVRGRIEVLGLVSDERKIELLAHARLLIITSKREGFPRVVAEALASGLPVITARYPQNGSVQVVEEFACGLCAEPNATDLADAAQTIMGDWQTWSTHCRQQAPQLDWSTLIRRLEALLHNTATTSDVLYTQQLKET